MKRLRGQILMGLGLIVLSAGLYIIQIRLFHAERDTFFYLFQDLAFVPIQVLIVTIIVDQVLRIREKMAMLNKLNMVIGTFFSDVGSRLLKECSAYDVEFEKTRRNFLVSKDWTDQTFNRARREAARLQYRLDPARNDLKELKTFLSMKRDFLLRLLENQNLLEHETFTDLLWAVFHLMQELEAREDLSRLPHGDAEHIAGDMMRVYAILTAEWLAYMKHLKADYPYLFSLAVRTNPFDPWASPVVQ